MLPVPKQVQVPEALTLDGKLSRTPQIASWHEHTSILFCDIQGFTDCCQAVPPSSVMSMFNELFFRQAVGTAGGVCGGEYLVAAVLPVRLQRRPNRCSIPALFPGVHAGEGMQANGACGPPQPDASRASACAYAQD